MKHKIEAKHNAVVMIFMRRFGGIRIVQFRVGGRNVVHAVERIDSDSGGDEARSCRSDELEHIIEEDIEDIMISLFLRGNPLGIIIIIIMATQ